MDVWVCAWGEEDQRGGLGVGGSDIGGESQNPPTPVRFGERYHFTLCMLDSAAL